MFTKKDSNRFNLLLLQEGEIYYEDFACSFSPSLKSSQMTKIPDFVKKSDISPVYPPQSSDNLFTFKCNQVVEMKKYNKSHPYNFRKYEEEIVIEFMYISTKDFLVKLEPIISLWNSKLEKTQIMEQLQKMYEKQKENFSFDVTWLEDFRETKLYESYARKVTPLVDVPGQLLITNEKIYFQPFNTISSKPVKKYSLRDVNRIVKRRYLLRQIGIELYLKNKSIYFAFDSEATRNAVYAKIIKLPELKNLQYNDQGNMTAKWQNGLISNFDYLLYLNFIADRSFNDLTQYPVFPWVIADHNSTILDLNQESTFRDLSKPIGALNPNRLKKFKQRYDEMPEPRFLYGTHYSTPGYVLYYLVRQAPEFMLRLQNGKFDAPDRSFHSIRDTWESVLTNETDVKELIPEFYQSTGEFLLNSKSLNLGIRQTDQKRVNHVQLPLWAKDEKDFVFRCREALESPYVSKNLHKWIDLIFGVKQRGVEAVKADNVFYHLTYEGAVDIEKETDPLRKASLEAQIREFGQTPKQIFTTSHPSRNVTTTVGLKLTKTYVTSSNSIPLDPIMEINKSTANSPMLSSLRYSSGMTSGDVDSPMLPSPKNLNYTGSNSTSAFDDVFDYFGSSDSGTLTSSTIEPLNKILSNDVILDNLSAKVDSPSSPISTISQSLSSLTTHSSSSNANVQFQGFAALKKSVTAKLHKDIISSAIMSKDKACVYTTSHDSTAKMYSLEKKQQLRRIGDMGDMALSSCALVTQQNVDNSNWIVVGSWDNNIYVYSIDYGRVLETLHGHDDAVSRICIHDNKLLSGSWDATVKLWQCTPSGFSNVPVLNFSEHETEVECVNVDFSGSLAVSGSKDGDIVVYDLKSNKAVNSFSAHNDAVSDIAFLDAETIVSVSMDQTVRISKVSTGQCLNSFSAKETLRCFVTDTDTILTGGDSGFLKLWSLDTGDLIAKFNAHNSSITCLQVSSSGNEVVTGSKSGELGYWKTKS